MASMCAGSLAAADNVASDLSHMHTAKSRHGERTGGEQSRSSARATAHLTPESAGTARMKRPGRGSISGTFQRNDSRAEKQGSARGCSDRGAWQVGDRGPASDGGERVGEAINARAGELERQMEHAERRTSREGRGRGNPDNPHGIGVCRGPSMDAANKAALSSAIASCNKFPSDGSFLNAYERTAAERTNARHQERAGAVAAGAVAHPADSDARCQEHENHSEGEGAGSAGARVGMAPPHAGGNYSAAAALRARLRGLSAPADSDAPALANVHVLPQVDAQVRLQCSRIC